MIGKLKGKLVYIENNVGLIETSGGVTYRVFLPPSLTSQTSLNSPIDLFTYLQVREDALVLFGFKEKKEYDFFTMLLSVSGVGPKTAFNVISSTKIEEAIDAIKTNDIDYFTNIPGLGKKTGMKIILELSQKLKEEFHMEKMYLSTEDKTVVDALISLGYSSIDAKKVLQKIPKNLSIEEKIKEALKISANSLT